MTWSVEFGAEAEKELSKLDPQVARRILRFLYECVALLENPRSVGQPLKGSKFASLWKYRVGDYRILVSIEDDILRVLVVRIGNRREVYR